MKRWHSLPGLMEALCLLGLAAFLAYLLLAGNYWMYLNPKFRGLSWTAASALAGLGAYSLARPPVGATWLRASLYLLVLCLCAGSELGVQKWLSSAGIDSQAMEQDAAPLPSRIKKSGVEYVRINIGELFDIASKPIEEKLKLDYSMRGFVRRTPETDAKGEFILYRVSLYCCYADTTAVGFRVSPPKGKDMPENGSWQVVYGSLSPSKDAEAEAVTSLGGSAFASVQPDFRFDARKMESEKSPGLGMMYEWRSEEPYAY